MAESDVVIRVEGLGKKYSIHHEIGERYSTVRDTWMQQARTAGRLLNPFTFAGQLRKSQRQASQERVGSKEDFWALQDVSFEIRRGERLGIIGRNGAGKSTLLKILSRITEPSTGRVEIRGRLASLLEVGTGFHPELTGRENIYLNGAILGMARREIRSKFDEIVDFAEVERFLDTPVKRYSSGMYVRLAFAVAAHLEPEILVVDEVLAVGDANFQKKCLGKMEEVADREGRTVLFVSHQMPMVASLCNRCLLMRDGRMTDDGMPSSVILKYQDAGFGGATSVDYTNSPKKPGDELARLLRAWVSDHQGQPNSEVAIQHPFKIHMVYEILRVSAGEPYPNIHLYDSKGNCAFVTAARVNRDTPIEPGIYHAICEMPGNLLNDGIFSAGLALTFSHNGITHVSFYNQNALNFAVVDSMINVPTREAGYTGPIPGVFRPILDWQVQAEHLAEQVWAPQ
jgi:lipopolysaccharide transport system ATP-binding protein